MKNDFLDNIIKEKLNQQQYEFTEADWSSFENKMSQSTPPGTGVSNTKWFLGGAAAIIVIAVASYVWISSDNTAKDNTVQSEQQQSKTIETNNLVENNLTPTDNKVENNVSIENNSSIESNTSINNTETPQDINNSNTTTDNSDEIKTNISNQNNETVSNESNNVTATNDNKDDSNNSSSVEIPTPSAVIMSGNAEICPGEYIALETIEQPNVIYAWSLGDGTYSSERSLTHTYTKTGKYTVTLIVTSTKDRNVLSKSKELVVEVLSAPNTDFEIDYLEGEIMPSVKLISSESLTSYHWDFGDGTYSSETSPVKNYKKKGYYNITLSSENIFGCSSKTSNKVTITEDYNLLAPNSFTPNGDGINDLFIPEALKTMDVEFTMTIYSQNQGLIFETKNINQQWDGSNQQNGENCTEGTYIWVVSLTNSQGKSEQYKGAVLLLK